MKRILIIPLAASLVGFAGPALSEEMDVAKVTCQDVAEMAPAQVLAIGLWMSGYVHGKNGDTVIDFKKMEANADLVDEHCAADPTQAVMTAVEKVTGAAK